MSRTTTAVGITPNFTVTYSHSPRPTWFLHQPNRWIKWSLDRNDHLYIFWISDGGTNFWVSLREVVLLLVRCFDSELQVRVFRLALPPLIALIPWVRKSARGFCHLIYRRVCGPVGSTWAKNRLKALNLPLSARGDIQKAPGVTLKGSLCCVGAGQIWQRTTPGPRLSGSRGCRASEKNNPTKSLMLMEGHWFRRNGTPRHGMRTFGWN